ncbi:MAG: Xaa-Pro peptidase family protein [Actinomycetota bacterium]|nr:Xaa-Pro peptidase family protein [Actinomycetota bacterium]
MRLSRIEKTLAEKQLDIFLITKPENIFYLTGFFGSSGIFLIGGKGAHLLVDFRYLEDAKEKIGDRPIEINLVKDGYIDSLAHLISNGKRLGYEADHLTVAKYRGLKERLSQAELVSTQGVIEGFRQVKDESEIEKITEAAAITDLVFQDIIGQIGPGATERGVAATIEQLIRARGGERAAFDVIVASGPNSARPHAAVTSRRLARGDFVKLDFGAAIGGYCSDMTRMVHLGPASNEERDIYELARRAQETALSSIRAKMSEREADATSRGIIIAAGFGDNFAHGLGHGVGLEIHERPTLSPKGDKTLEEGMVFTIEPAIYFEGRFGVRIEDTVLLEGGGIKPLNKVPKELIEI